MNQQNRYDSLFQLYGEKYNLDWLLLKAQAKQESMFNPDAINKGSQAKGLGQIIPSTFNEWSKKLGLANANPYNPEHSIYIQAAYMDWLRDYLKKYVKDEKDLLGFMLSAYNWGIKYVLQLVKAGNDFENAFNKMPDETKGYFEKIRDYYLAYRIAPIEVDSISTKEMELPQIKSITLNKDN